MTLKMIFTNHGPFLIGMGSAVELLPSALIKIEPISSIEEAFLSDEKKLGDDFEKVFVGVRDEQ